MFGLLIAVLFCSPPAAARLVAMGHEPDQRALLAIQYRESRGRWISRHKVDHRPHGWRGNGSAAAWHVGSRAWIRAVQVGLLDPGRCRHHERGDARDWSTRGAFGHVAAYGLPYVPGCWPPWVLDLPIVSAWVARERLAVARRPWAPPALKRWATAP